MAMNTASPEAGRTLVKAWMIFSESILQERKAILQWSLCCFINLFSSPFDIKGMASSGQMWSLNRKMKGLYNLPDVYWVNIILYSSGNWSKTAIKDREKEKCQKMQEKTENREIIQKVQHPSNISFRRTYDNPQPPASSKKKTKTKTFFPPSVQNRTLPSRTYTSYHSESGNRPLRCSVKFHSIRDKDSISTFLVRKKYSRKDWKSEWYQLPQQQF